MNIRLYACPKEEREPFEYLGEITIPCDDDLLQTAFESTLKKCEAVAAIVLPAGVVPSGKCYMYSYELGLDANQLEDLEDFADNGVVQLMLLFAEHPCSTIVREITHGVGGIAEPLSSFCIEWDGYNLK